MCLCELSDYSQTLQWKSISHMCVCWHTFFHSPSSRSDYTTMESSSLSSSSCREGAGARPLLLLLRRVRAGREAFPLGGPREEEEEEEWEEEEGIGATAALTLLCVPTWRPWPCGWMETTDTLHFKTSAHTSCKDTTELKHKMKVS